MKRFWIFTLLVFTSLTVGCDYQNRFSDSGADSQMVQKFVQDLDTLNSSGGTGYSGSLQTSFVDLYDNAEVTYFAWWQRDDQYMGPIEAVAPLDFTVLGANFHYTQLALLRVYLFDDWDDPSATTLVYEYATIDNPGSVQLLVFQGTGYLEEDGVYYLELSNGNTSFVAYSYDTLEDGLKEDGIQLRFAYDEESDFGKVSNLEGFSK